MMSEVVHVACLYFSQLQRNLRGDGQQPDIDQVCAFTLVALSLMGLLPSADQRLKDVLNMIARKAGVEN